MKKITIASQPSGRIAAGDAEAGVTESRPDSLA
jgi:hypothetical protein